ncbi:unnamed protein product [Ixodes persulcatus]
MLGCCRPFSISASSRNRWRSLFFSIPPTWSSHHATATPVAVSSPLYTVLNDPRPISSSNLRKRPSGDVSRACTSSSAVSDAAARSAALATAVVVTALAATTPSSPAAAGEEGCPFSSTTAPPSRTTKSSGLVRSVRGDDGCSAAPV